MPDGLVHESEEKLRAHLSAHGDPVSDWTTNANLMTMMMSFQWSRQDFVTGGVRYGSIGGLEYEAPQKLTHLLQCMGNL